jgi:hypothetical protein
MVAAPSPPRRTRGTRWGTRLVLGLGSLLGTAVLGEIGFRLAASEPWYLALEEEQSEVVPTQAIGGEHFGTRPAPKPSPKQPGVYRILFLGDSFTYGSGVADAARVFPSLVVARLNERVNESSELAAGPADRRYELFNGGIPGSLTDRWVRLFQAAVKPLEPDLVVAVFFLRDGTRGVGGSGDMIREIGAEMAALARTDWLFRSSHAYRFFRERSAQRELSRRYLGGMREAYLGTPEQTGEWRNAQANLRAIRDEIERRGGEFALVVFPVLFELGANYPLADVCAEVERFARQDGMKVFSLLPTFLGLEASSLWVSPLDQHPNEDAHALAADAITAFLLPIVTGSD